jgi:hypothetical protein
VEYIQRLHQSHDCKSNPLLFNIKENVSGFTMAMLSPFRKVKNCLFLSLSPLGPKGGIANNQQFEKVPLGGFRGKLTFRSGLNVDTLQ